MDVRPPIAKPPSALPPPPHLTMGWSISNPPVSSTCGRCGYSACICYKTASKFAHTEYELLGIHPGATPFSEGYNPNGYGHFTDRFLSELDGLQTGVDYLYTIEEQVKEPPVRLIHGKTPQKLATPDFALGLDTYSTDPNSIDPNWIPRTQCNFDLHHTDQFFQDGITPSLVETTHDSWLPQYDYRSNEYVNFWLTSASHDLVSIRLDEERDYASQQSTCSKELPTISQVPSEETTNVEMDELPTIAKKVPQKSQWATLQELHMSSKFHYMKFLRLTANHNSRGIKMLRRMYGSPKGILATGITAFRDVLEGQEPQSLKEIFAVTCLSYVISKLLQKHGRMEGSQVLADTDQWRLAIKKEKDRRVYDEVIKILWPEINFLKEHSKEKHTNSTPPPTKPHLGSMVPVGLTFNASTGPLYAPSSMLAYGMTASSAFNFLEGARVADCFNIENDIQSALQDLDSHLDPDNQPHDYGLHDHVKGLLLETSTHDNFMFADFLNFGDPQLDNNIGASSEKQPPDITPMTHPPDRLPQMFPPNEPVSTLDPKILGNASPLVADSKVLDQTELLAPEADEVPTVPPLLGSLIATIMFQVVVEFMKFITSLGDLLFCLSGCGISSRRRKHEAAGYTRPVREFGEFVTGAIKHVLEPIKEDLGEVDESVDAVLCMADSFVRLGCLRTVREIEEYIITTARHIAFDYTSFTTIMSKTLNQCLAASDQMTWDHIYPSYTTDQEDYSTAYIKKTEAIEIEWAIQNFKKEDDGEDNVNSTNINDTQTAKPITTRHESSSSSDSDSLPSKRQKLSPPSPNSSNERQSSTTPASSSSGDLPAPPKAHCHYLHCKRSYTGKDARVNLRRHIRTLHEGCKAIKCPNCEYESSRRDNVRKHFLLKHTGEHMPAVLTCKTRA